MTRSLADRPHVWRPGSGGGGPGLLLLHGTGGDENSLVYAHEQLAPGAPLLSVRGLVDENGMNRFFRRIEEGVLDEEDLTLRTHELADFLVQAQRTYGFAPGSLVAVGFSNGAVAAVALLLHRPDLLAGVVSIAGTSPYRHLPPVSVKPRRQCLVMSGASDTIVTSDMAAALVRQLQEVGAVVHTMPYAGDHEVPNARLPEVAEIIRGWAPPPVPRGGRCEWWDDLRR